MDNIEKKDVSPNNIIKEHRAHLMISGQISDFQLKNIKTWPFIAFDDIEKVKLAYSFKLDENSEQENALGVYAGYVTYDIYFKKNAKISSDKKQKAFEQLILWTKFLFWEDTQVFFKRGGKKWS
jgi:hypothetical protein